MDNGRFISCKREREKGEREGGERGETEGGGREVVGLEIEHVCNTITMVETIRVVLGVLDIDLEEMIV